MIYAKISRINNDPVRGILTTLWFPIVFVDWLATVLQHDPKQLLTPRPYEIAMCMYLIGIDGCFVASGKG